MESFGDSQQESGFPSAAMESEPSEEHRPIPCQCLADMIPDFKRVLKNTADDITELSKLTFMSDTGPTSIKGEKLTALDILWKQVQKGKFAHDNVEPLERLLKDIDRCDLVSQHIDPYKQKYGEHTTSRGLLTSPGVPSRNLNSPARLMQRTSSAQSLPASTLSQISMYNTSSPSNSATSMTGTTDERKAHTDPSSQRSRLNKRERAKAQAYAAAGDIHSRHHCTTVPEEESSSTSLQLPVGPLHHNMVPSFPPQCHVRAGQNQPDTQGEVCSNRSRSQTPSTVAEHSSLGNAAAVGMSTPTRPRRSPSSIRPSSSLSIGYDPHWQPRHGSATPRELLSTPASEYWSANHNPDTMEEPSFSLSELEESGEYNLPSLPRDVNSRCSTAASGLSYPCLHNRSYPNDSKSLSACSNPFPRGHHEKQFPYSQHTDHSSCYSLPTTIPSPMYPSPQSAFQYGQQHGHMATRYQRRQQGACGSGSSTQAPKTHTEKHTWAVTRKSLLNGIERHGKPLKNRVNFTLPVGCRKRRDPKVYLNVIPCERKESRHMTIEGELLIPRGCSRHKWLVEYCDCSVCLSVSVINPNNNKVLGNKSEEFAIEHSEVNRDHRTHMKLDEVLEHEAFLYDARVEKFHFHASVRLFEHEYRLGHTVQYEYKECDLDFTEISILSVPSQVASPQ